MCLFRKAGEVRAFRYEDQSASRVGLKPHYERGKQVVKSQTFSKPRWHEGKGKEIEAPFDVETTDEV